MKKDKLTYDGYFGPLLEAIEAYTGVYNGSKRERHRYFKMTVHQKYPFNKIIWEERKVPLTDKQLSRLLNDKNLYGGND